MRKEIGNVLFACAVIGFIAIVLDTVIYVADHGPDATLNRCIKAKAAQIELKECKEMGK